MIDTTPHASIRHRRVHCLAGIHVTQPTAGIGNGNFHATQGVGRVLVRHGDDGVRVGVQLPTGAVDAILGVPGRFAVVTA